jgi:hypothetical protein
LERTLQAISVDDSILVAAVRVEIAGRTSAAAASRAYGVSTWPFGHR